MNISKFFKRIYRYKNENDITFDEMTNILNTFDNVVLVDVRSIQEYREEHLPDSINLPLYELEKNANRVIPNLNSVIILYCQSGIRSQKALKLLKNKGYKNLYSLENGLDGM